MYRILEEISLLHTYQVGIIMKIINMTLDEAIELLEFSEDIASELEI